MEEDSPDKDSRPWIIRKLFPTGYFQELKAILNTGWAMVLTGFAEISMQAFAIMFGGHLGKIELDAVTLSNTLINVTGTAVCLGAAKACDTTFSQTYGSGNLKMMGIYLQRSIIIMLLILCLSLTFALNAEWILLHIGQNPEVSRLVGKYLLTFCPGLLFNCLLVVFRKFLQSQDLVYPHLIIGLTGMGVNISLQYLLLYQVQMGIVGSSLAQVSAYGVMLIQTLLYICCTGICRETWPGWSWRCLEDWGLFLHMAFFGILLVCLEWWAYEIFTILSGVLGTLELAAFSIVFQLEFMFYAIPFGIATACSIRVGQFLGAGQPKSAINTYGVGLSILLCNSLVTSILFATLRWELPKLFTRDLDVIRLAADLVLISAVAMFFQGTAAISREVLQGMGRQWTGTIIVFVAFYLINMPISIPLMFLTPLRLHGMWGATCGVVILVSFLLFFTIYFVFDWDKLSQEAIKRAGIVQELKTNEEYMSESERKKSTLLNNNGYSRTYSSFDDMKLLEQPECDNDKPKGSLLVKRFITVLSFLGILLLGIVLRMVLYVPTENVQALTLNSTERLLMYTPL